MYCPNHDTLTSVKRQEILYHLEEAAHHFNVARSSLNEFRQDLDRAYAHLKEIAQEVVCLNA